jgi:hypothetical protein
VFSILNVSAGLEDSLSGSASSDEGDDDSDAVSTLVNKTKRLTARSPSPDSTPGKLPASALIWFHSPPSIQLGFYKAVLPLGTESSMYTEELRKMQRLIPGGRKWAMFMVAGGHFAGAIVRVSHPEEGTDEEVPSRQGKKPKKSKSELEVLLHKTFHRYTSMSVATTNSSVLY